MGKYNKEFNLYDLYYNPVQYMTGYMKSMRGMDKKGEMLHCLNRNIFTTLNTELCRKYGFKNRKRLGKAVIIVLQLGWPRKDSKTIRKYETLKK